MKINSFGISSQVIAAGELAHCNLKPAVRYGADQDRVMSPNESDESIQSCAARR